MSLPEPLVSSEVDLRSFPFMAIDVVRLQRSKHWLIARQNPEIGFYSINLWMAAWHELPAASIENDDEILSALAGCTVERWQQVKHMVLRNWVLCSDNRLYHPVVAEKAKEAWGKKLGRQKQTKAATYSRNRKDNGELPGSENVTNNVTTNVTSTLEPETIHVTRSIREEKRREDCSVPNGTDAVASRVVDVGKQVWNVGLKLLAGYEIPEQRARPILGKWVKAAGSEGKLLEVLNEAGSEERAEIVSFVEAALKPKDSLILVDWLYGLQGGPMKRTTAEFQVESWVSSLGLHAVTEAITKAKSVGWKRDKTIEHLDDLAAGKNRDSYEKPKEITAMIPSENQHWANVRDTLCSEDPKAKSWLGDMVKGVSVNSSTVKIRAASRVGAEQIEKYGPRLLEIFQVEKPGIEIVEVGL